jgi:arylsulfatase B
MRNILLSLSAVLVATSVFAEDSRPNIVLLFADDLGYGELGCQGNKEIPTPNIDSIAVNGVRFTNGYVSAPYCSASRAGLLTGRFQTRFGYEFNPVGSHNDDPRVKLPREEITIAEALQNAGYATGLVGKWHLGGSAAAHPLRHGFDEFFGFLHEGHFFVPPPYENVTTMLRRRVLPNGTNSGRWQNQSGKLILSAHMGHNEPPYDANNPILRAGQPVVEGEYLTDALTREANSFIDRNAKRPFFLYLAYNAVHSPLQARDEDMQKFAHIDDVHRRIFAGMLSRLDHSVGSVLSNLKRKQLLQNTLVFFISDNGGPTKELTSSNLPLRGGKGQLYEGGIRVPFLMQWPERIEGGREFDKPVSSLDVMGTAAAVAKARLNRTIDGVSLLPFLTRQESGAPHETLFWRQGKQTAIRSGDWKLIRPRSRKSQPQWELYDLSNDPTESNNLAAGKHDKMTQMIDVWSKLDKQMSEPVWRPQR